MNFARTLTEKCVQAQIIPQEEKEIYCYLFDYLFDSIFYGGSILFISILIHQTIPSIIFLLVSILPRKYGDGYHASSKVRCQILSYSIYVIVIISNKIILNSFSIIWFFLYSVSIVGTFLLSSVNTANKTFSSARKKELKKRLLIHFLVLTFIEIFALHFHFFTIYLNISICAIISLLSTLAGVIKEKSYEFECLYMR